VRFCCQVVATALTISSFPFVVVPQELKPCLKASLEVMSSIKMSLEVSHRELSFFFSYVLFPVVTAKDFFFSFFLLEEGGVDSHMPLILLRCPFFTRTRRLRRKTSSTSSPWSESRDRRQRRSLKWARSQSARS
jgi:hypothetical protein